MKKMTENNTVIANNLTLAFLLFTMFIFVFYSNSVEGAELEKNEIIIKTDNAIHNFTVEIADDDKKRSKGLMFRESMDDNRGMLFLYNTPQEVSMWMKNTLIPLDMIFFNEKNHIINIVSNTTPKSLEIIPSGGKVTSVLEVNGGITKKLSIRKGDAMIICFENNIECRKYGKN